MKRFLMYIVVAIVLVSAGFSIYYVVRNDEEIYSEIAGEEVFYINQDETLTIPIVRDNPAEHTDITLKGGYEDYLEVDLENWTVTGKSAGIATLTFYSTNKKYEGEAFEVHCRIGNGTVTYPYYIRNEQDILNIGKGQYKLSSSYEVVNNISMTAPMMPIGVKMQDGDLTVSEFSGTITGGVERHRISNANIKIDGAISSKSSGFFAVLGSTAKVENLVFENIKVEGYHAYAGTIAGTNFGLIGMCEVKNGSVVNTYERGYTGGIVGLNKHAAGSDDYAQINICSANVDINSKWVAGGAAGKNSGGVIYNCLLKTNNLTIDVPEGQDSQYSYFGGIAGISLCGESGSEIYDSYVANCLVYIDNVLSKSSHVAGIFGAYYGKSSVYESEGNYKMLMYVADSSINTYYLCDDEVEISDKNPAFAMNYAKHITTEEALVKKTYTAPSGSNWDFKSVWSLIPKESIAIAFDNDDEENPLAYQAFTSNGQTITIESDKDLKSALSIMRATPNKNFIYEVKNSVTFNGKDNDWQPIGSKERPFKGQFKMADDVTITISKVNVNAEYAGLFGFVSGNNTIIKNIILKDSQISGTMAGGIVAFNDGATIENCQILGADTNIYTNKYAGTIAGYNTGNIKNCLINYEQTGIDEETEEPVYGFASGSSTGIYVNENTAEQVIYLGGVAGKNAGIIDNVISGNIIMLQIAGKDRTLFAGGVAGMNEGNINAAIVKNGYSIDGKNYIEGSAWVGGVVGYHYKGEIKSSAITGAEDKTASSLQFETANENVVAGGIAGYVARDAQILYSVADFININAYAIGGFAGRCDGVIDQSYVSHTCVMNGVCVGGFTARLDGQIKDCMTAAEISGTKVEAGMTVYLQKGSQIDYCYADVTFKLSTDDAKDKATFAETSSAFRAWPKKYGNITNSIIVADTKETGEVDYFTFNSMLIDPNLKYVTGLKVKIGGVDAEMQLTFLGLEFSKDFTTVDGYTALYSTPNGLLSSKGFLSAKWNYASDDADPTQLALPTKAAEVVRANIVEKHVTETPSEGEGQPADGSTESGGTTTPPEGEQGGTTTAPEGTTSEGTAPETNQGSQQQAA